MHVSVKSLSWAATAYGLPPGAAAGGSTATGEEPVVTVPQFAYRPRHWLEGVDAPTNGVSTRTTVHGLTQLVRRHIASFSMRIFNILSVIYAPSRCVAYGLAAYVVLHARCYGRPTHAAAAIDGDHPWSLLGGWGGGG